MTRAKLQPAARLRLAALGLCALTLGGCISLLPKSEPAQLYRFGLAPPAQARTATPAAETVGVFRAGGLFQHESAGDRLLTITGERAAYIAGARWVAPATVLWDQAVLDAFDAAPGRVRLISRGEPRRTDYALELDVRNFETRYEGRGAPIVLVRLRASLTGEKTRATVGERIFEARVTASENRVSAIVAAYDEAVRRVLGELLAWTAAALA